MTLTAASSLHSWGITGCNVSKIKAKLLISRTPKQPSTVWYTKRSKCQASAGLSAHQPVHLANNSYEKKKNSQIKVRGQRLVYSLAVPVHICDHLIMVWKNYETNLLMNELMMYLFLNTNLILSRMLFFFLESFQANFCKHCIITVVKYCDILRL